MLNVISLLFRLAVSLQPKIVNSADHKEEEHMHDSGHYELTEARKRAARIESIANDPKISSLLEIRHPINKTYRFVLNKISFQNN